MFTLHDLTKLSKKSNENLTELIEINNNYLNLTASFNSTFSINETYLDFKFSNKNDLELVLHYAINSREELDVNKFVFIDI